MSVAAIRRRQRRTRHGLAGYPATVLARRTVAPIGRGVGVPYPVVVPSPTIDREAWAEAVEALIQEESGGNKTRFAETVGVDRKTVGRWLTGTVSVSAESVRAVATVLGVPPAELLFKVGYYRPEDLPQEPAPAATASDDAAVALIRSSDLPPSLKRALVADFTERRKQDETRRLEEARRQIDLLRRSRRTA